MPHATPWGEIPDDGIVRLGERTYAYYGPQDVFANSAIVVGEDATLVFDANDVRCGRHLRTAVDRHSAGRPLRYLVLSHAHDDHAHGAWLFAPPARVLSRAWTRERLAYWSGRDLQPFIDEKPHYAEEYRTCRIVIPDEAVEEVRTIDLGGAHVRLHPVALAHTPGDLFGVVEEDRITLCGDLLFNRYATYVGGGSLAGSLAALEVLKHLDVSLYLPGHGPACGPEAIEAEAAFLLDLREAVRAARSEGLTGVALVEAVKRRMDRWHDLPFFHEPWMMPDNVEAVVRELEGSNAQG